MVTSASTSFNVCVTSSGFDCSKDCRNKLGEYSSAAGSLGCGANGETLKQAVDDIVEVYDDQCGTNGGASGSHGYPAAHYMLAILEPMALLCL